MINTQLILDYLTDLSNHNEREWYHAHKAEYKEANAEFEALVQELIFRIGEFDSSILNNQPKDLTFKLVRDTRFSNDKSPYNPAFRAHIAANGREWEEILAGPDFRKYFTVKGTALKKVPAGYDKEHPLAEFLKFKSWYLEYPFADDGFADGEAFLNRAVTIFHSMKPFNDYLNRALAGFQMPKIRKGACREEIPGRIPAIALICAGLFCQIS